MPATLLIKQVRPMGGSGMDLLVQDGFIAGIELLLNIATHGGAAVMGDTSYGLQVGKRADCVIVPGDTPTEAVMEQPARTYVLKGGQVVAAPRGAVWCR